MDLFLVCCPFHCRVTPDIDVIGALYYLSTWYKKDETSFRTTLFFFGQMFAGATASLISAGLLRLSGKGGLAGWRWVWLGMFSSQRCCSLR